MLYHYNTNSLSDIRNLELQGDLSEVTKQHMKNVSTFRSAPHPYYKSVSCFIDPIPLDIPKYFCKGHTVWSTGAELHEHAIALTDLNILGWKIVESDVSTAMLKYLPWVDCRLYQILYYKFREAVDKVVGNTGNDLASLRIAIEQYKGDMEELLAKADTLRQKLGGKHQYASFVPHVLLYTDSVIDVFSTKKLTLI